MYWEKQNENTPCDINSRLAIAEEKISKLDTALEWTKIKYRGEKTEKKYWREH